MTVLFADTKASMELLANRDPEEARRLLDPVLELMMEAVHHYSGTVNHVMGDGIMALFGAPLAQEDHAVRGCYAALRMQESIGRQADGSRVAAGADIQLRVGLHSGEVVVRSIRTDLHDDYTAVGQTTHLAARMEQIAAPGTIRITADVVRLAEGYIEAIPIGSVAVKGVSEPVEVFQLSGARPVRSRFADRELTQLVERREELEQLFKALRRAGTGHGQVVAVVGEPGVGKSRLFWEFTRSSDVSGCLLLETNALSYGQATAYLPVISLLKSYLQIEPHDDHMKIREKLIGKLLALEIELEPALPALLSILDVSLDHPGWRAKDPGQHRRDTLAVLKRLLVAQSRLQPVVIAMENLQWIDSETQTVLDSLIEGLPAARILLLVNHRPEYRHGWSGLSYYTQLRLDPLRREGTEEFLRLLLGEDESLGPLKRHLVARTGGNPFFLEESSRTLIETRMLVGERGAYSMASDRMAVQLPATVQAVLAARIDRLPPAEKRILQSGAVIGTHFPFQLLRAIIGLSEDAVRAGLKHLQAAEFVYERRLFPDVEYMFTHALTHEVAYTSLLQGRRRELHAQIVYAIERRFPEWLTEQVEVLAHHASMAEMWWKAVTYWRQAGAKAAMRSATREAVGALEQALNALGRLPETRETLELGIDLRFDLQSALIPIDELKRMVDYLSEAERLAEAIGDQRRLGRVSAHMTYCFAWTGDSEKAVRCGERALAIAVATDDRALELLTHFHLGRALIALGQHRRAIESLSRTEDGLVGERLYERFGMPAFPAVTCRALKALCLASLGEFSTARRTAENGLRVAEAAEHPFSLGVALWSVGLVHMLQGNGVEALKWLERSVQLCRKNNFTNLVVLASAPLGHARALTGQVAEGLALLEETTLQVGSVNTASHAANLSRLAEVYLLADRAADATDTVERALQVSRGHGHGAGIATALRVAGDVYAASPTGDRREAERVYQQARQLAEGLEMRPLVAHCDFGLGRLYVRLGNTEEARKRLTAATSMYRDMGMTDWLEQADAELRSLG